MSLPSHTSVVLLASAILAVNSAVNPEVASRQIPLAGSASNSLFTPTGADDIISKHKYPVESHKVRTQDGYVLTIHRIPFSPGQENNKRGRPILLHSGLMGSAGDWVVLGPNRSLGFILADAGFDVWLANPRGSTHSKSHIELNSTGRAFWDFSWHEIGHYDLPAEIDYILSATGYTSLSYGSLSMGSTVFWVLGSTRPEYMTKINKMVAFGPVAFCENTRDRFTELLAMLLSNYGWILEATKIGEILTATSIMKTVTGGLCFDGSWSEGLCRKVAETYGLDATNVKASDIAEIFAYAPAGTSLKSLIHFAQIVADAPSFKMYDYGKWRNIFLYGQLKPLNYELSRVTAPVYIFRGDADNYTNEKNLGRLLKQLPNVQSVTLVNCTDFRHIDFVLSDNAHKFVYPDVVKIFKSDENRYL